MTTKASHRRPTNRRRISGGSASGTRNKSAHKVRGKAASKARGKAAPKVRGEAASIARGEVVTRIRRNASKIKDVTVAVWKHPHVRNVLSAVWAIVLLLGLLCLVRHHIHLYADMLDLPSETLAFIARETAAVALIVLYVIAEGIRPASKGLAAITQYAGAGCRALAVALERLANWFNRS